MYFHTWMGVIEIEKYRNTIFLSFKKVYLHYFSSEFWLYNGKPIYVADSLNLNLFNRLIACKADCLQRCISFINWYMYIPIRIKFFYSQENSQKFPNKFIAHSYFNIAWHCYVTIRRTCNLMLLCYKLLGIWRIKIYSFIHF